MRKVEVYYKEESAGVLTENNNGSYTFVYHELWVVTDKKPSISLTMPKEAATFFSETFFAFFYHLLPEGANRNMVCEALKIDKYDDFSILIAIAKNDAIGAITVKAIN